MENPSFVASLLGNPSVMDMDERDDIVSWTASSMYGGAHMFQSAYSTHLRTSRKAGVEAVYATITNFILAMMEYPEAQRNAQNEIDSVARNSFGLS